jgi:hypothetical protein
MRGVAPEVGDLVLVKKLHFEGKHKLEDKYEEDAYRIVRKDSPELLVYTVKLENGTGRERTLHRNHLLPIVWPLEQSRHDHKVTKNRKRSSVTKQAPVAESPDNSSEDEDHFVIMT